MVKNPTQHMRKEQFEAVGLTNANRLPVTEARKVRRRIGYVKEAAIRDAVNDAWHLDAIGFVERAEVHVGRIRHMMAYNGKDALLLTREEIDAAMLLSEEEREDELTRYSELRKCVVKAELFGGDALSAFHDKPYKKGAVCIYITRTEIAGNREAMPGLAGDTEVPLETAGGATFIWYKESDDLLDSMLAAGRGAYALLANRWKKFTMAMMPHFRSKTNIIVQCPASAANYIAEECAALGCRFFVLESNNKIYKPAYAMTDLLRTVHEPTSNIKLKLLSLTVGRRIVWPIEDEAMADTISLKIRQVIGLINKNGYDMEFQYGRFVVDGNLYYLLLKTSDKSEVPAAVITDESPPAPV